MCSSAYAPGLKFLSPVDLTLAEAQITCRLQAHADLALLTEKDLLALVQVLKFLSSL